MSTYKNILETNRHWTFTVNFLGERQMLFKINIKYNYHFQLHRYFAYNLKIQRSKCDLPFVWCHLKKITCNIFIILFVIYL